ncbi:MAG: amidohydrolase family protein [Candidatus Thermoplasmatota archaeon]|nr:amidohydrolase family protein [Candidatus Thermoplasmatota archaeon]
MSGKTLAVNNALILGVKGKNKPIEGSLLIKDEFIKKISDEPFDADKVIDANKNLLIPGFINTHSHVAMSRFKGLLDDIKLSEFLEKTFKLDSQRTDEDIYNSSIMGICEMIDSGITAFADLYYSEDIIARAVEDTGIRGFLSWNTLDKKFTTQTGEPIENAENFIRSFSKKSALITPSIGVQGIYVASDDTYLKAYEISKKYGTIIHTHLAETREEINNCMKERGKRPVEQLDSIGFLNENLLAAHTVWLNLSEVRALSKKNVSISWNSVSNEKLGVGGIPPIPEMMAQGVNVSMGTDSCGSNNSLDMFCVMKNSALSLKNSRWDPSILNADELFQMATQNGSYAVHNNSIGSIGENMLADLVLIDLGASNMFPTSGNNAVNNIIYSANPGNTQTVIVNGNVLKENFRFSKNLEKLKRKAMRYVRENFITI